MAPGPNKNYTTPKHLICGRRKNYYNITYINLLSAEQIILLR
jgi:hypothetical protein